MIEHSELCDRVGDSLPRSFGVTPVSRGRGRGAAGTSRGDDYTVVPSPPLDESFLACFEHATEDPYLEGMPLFAPATPACELALARFREHACLRACAILANDAMAGRGRVPWASVVREIVSGLRGDSPRFRARAPAAPSHLAELRRRVLREAAFSSSFAQQLAHQRPFVVMANQVVAQLRPNWDFRREASHRDIVDITLLPEPWFDAIVTRASAEFAGERDAGGRQADERFCADLAAARATVRGAGELHAFSVSAPAPGRLRVSLDTGAPFFMEISPDKVVLWPTAVVSVEADASMLLGPRTDLTVRLGACAGVHERTEVSRLLKSSGLAHLASQLTLHPFVNREMSFCVGTTSQRNRQLAQPASVADAILACHLRGAARVYRYGWRASNQNRIYQDPRVDPAPPGLNVIPLADAAKLVAAHPEIELVRWQR